MPTPKLHYLPGLDPAALDSVLQGWRQDYPQMGVLALLPEAEKDRLPTLQQVCTAQQVKLVGAIFPALVVGGRIPHGGRLAAAPGCDAGARVVW